MRILLALLTLLSISSSVFAAPRDQDLVESSARCQAHGYPVATCLKGGDSDLNKIEQSTLQALIRCDVAGVKVQSCLDIRESFARCQTHGTSVKNCLLNDSFNAQEKALVQYLQRCDELGIKITECL